MLLKDWKITCGGCPMIAEFTCELGEGSVNYRWGCLRIFIKGEVVYSEQVGDALDGIMAEDVLKDSVQKALASLV